MKNTLTSSKPIISILLILSLVLSIVPVVIPSASVNAAITLVTVASPSTGTPRYVKTGGSVTVTFDVTTDAAAAGDINIKILQAGTSTIQANNPVNNYVFALGANAGLNWDVTLTGAATGNYDVVVSVRQPTGTGTWVDSATMTNAVIVDNTLPVVQLTNPNGGNYVKSDADYTVTWNATDSLPPGDVLVSAKYNTDGSSTFTSVAFAEASKVQGVNSATWTAASIPDTDTAIAKLQLTVKDTAGNETVVVSAANFYILNTVPTIASITAPIGSTLWNGGSVQNISFTTTSALSLPVDYKIEFWNGSGWSIITPGSGGWVLNQPVGLTNFSWTVNNAYRGSAAQVRITVRDKVLREPVPTSSAAFTIVDITPPTVSVTVPAAGATLFNGTATTVKWTAYDNVTGVNLIYNWYLSVDNGSSWLLLGTSNEAQSPSTPISKPWTPSVTETKPTCKMKVTATDQATPTANTFTAYSGTFSIVYAAFPPTVTLSSPNSDPLTGGTCTIISWTANDTSNPSILLTYDLHYSTDGGATYPNLIATLTNREQGANSFSWAVPGTGGTLYRVRVTATSAGGSATAASSSDITVTADTTVFTGSITLQPGWNLVSLEYIPTCTSIESVLAAALSRVDSVWYLPGGSSAWQSWAPSAPASLTTIVDGKAYWIKVTSGAAIPFTFQGRKGPPGGGTPATPYNYVVGWNMVGFKSTIAKTVATYLGGTCGTSYNVPIYGWNATTQAWASPFTTTYCDGNMLSDSGYFVYFNVPVTVNAGPD